MDPEKNWIGTMNKITYERYFDSQKLSTIIETGDHKEIIKWVKKNKLCLQSMDSTGQGRTLMSQILEEVANGHLIVKEILNSYVAPTNQSLKPSSNDYGVDLDFHGLTHQSEDGTGEQESAITDLVRLIMEHKGNLWSRSISHIMDFILPDACFTERIRPNQKVVNRIKGKHFFVITKSKYFTQHLELMCHPVMACLITLKWKKVLKYFAFHIFILSFFLLSFYFYIRYIFSFMKVEAGNPNQTKPILNSTSLPFFLTDSSEKGLFFAEFVFAISTLLLLCLEFYQLLHLKCKNYWKQTENWNQIFIIKSAVLAMVMKPWILEITLTGEIVRGITALGFCASCFDFIFTLGKYPFRGGDFSIMFTRVLTRLINYVVAMFIFVGGFSCSLEIVTYGTGLTGFQAPFKNFVLTLTMAMGEFNARDLYEDYMGQNEDEEEHWKIGRTFAMFLLVLLVMAGTITMVNLFVAVIIKDTKMLEEEVFKEKLFYMAEASIMIKTLVPKSRQASLAIESTRTFCVHEMCAAKCDKKRIPSNITHLEPDLLKLAEAGRG